MDLTKHLREVHKFAFKICKACKLIFKVKECKGHFCEPDRPRPKAIPVKKSPEKSPEKSLEKSKKSSDDEVKELPEVIKTPAKMTPIKGTVLLGYSMMTIGIYINPVRNSNDCFKPQFFKLTELFSNS